MLQPFSRSPSLSPNQLLRHQSTMQLQRIQGLLHQAPGHPHGSGLPQQPPGHQQSPERPFSRLHTFASPAQLSFAQTHSTRHLLQQPSLPKSGFSHSHESRLDSSEAAHRALLSEEAERMLRHVAPDGTSCQAARMLRTPHHLTPLIAACQTARALQTLDLSHNSLSDSALEQVEGKLHTIPLL